MSTCRLGFEEHDGHRYCFEHAGFAFAAAGRMHCDRADQIEKEADRD